MTNLYDVLEMCLKEIEQGADVDTVLFRHPEFANELRPILEASVKAKAKAVPAPSTDALRRNRAKLLQHASEMRERKAVPVSRRIWSVPFRRALVALMVVTMLFASSTGLVRASSTTLPGDNLYPVKRSWESLSLFFTFNVEKREALEFEHENERLEELYELFAEGRSADVEFSGYVTRQSGDEWLVSSIPVMISSQTRLPDQPVQVGDAVRVRGQARDGGVAALRIELLPSGIIVPVGDDEPGIEGEEAENSNEQSLEDSGSRSENEAPEAQLTVVPTPVAKPQKLTLEGVVTSIMDKLIVVNGVVMDIKSAEVKGTPLIGAIVKAEGTFDDSGVFIVTKIEFKAVIPAVGPGTSGANGNDNANDDNDKANDNSNDHDENDDDDNKNDNKNDNNANGSGGD